jgi:hypothetical protein
MDNNILWGEDGQELLRHHSANEAIEEVIDGYHPGPIDGDWEISVYEYQPIKPGIDSCGSPLERVLEILDEEYGDPDGDGHDRTEAMKAAEKTFIEAVLTEYRSWMCEQTGKVVTVNALEWTKEHRPDWITAQTGRTP